MNDDQEESNQSYPLMFIFIGVIFALCGTSCTVVQVISERSFSKDSAIGMIAGVQGSAMAWLGHRMTTQRTLSDIYDTGPRWDASLSERWMRYSFLSKKRDLFLNLVFGFNILVFLLLVNALNAVWH